MATLVSNNHDLTMRLGTLAEEILDHVILYLLQAHEEEEEEEEEEALAYEARTLTLT